MKRELPAGASIAASAQLSSNSWYHDLTNATPLSAAGMIAAQVSNLQHSALNVINGLHGSTPWGYNFSIKSAIDSIAKPTTSLNEFLQKSHSAIDNIPNIFPIEKHDTGNENINI